MVGLAGGEAINLKSANGNTIIFFGLQEVSWGI
jgi:hypothetical protein